MADSRSGRDEEGIGRRNPLGSGEGRGLGRDRLEPLGQAVDLGDVEHGVGFQEADILLGFLSGRLVTPGLRSGSIVDDGRSRLAFAHLRPELLGLTVRHPGR